MYIDKTLQFSSDQALTADANSTDLVDFGSDRNIGPGAPMYLVVVAKAGLTGGAGPSPSIQIEVQTDSNLNFSSPTTIATSQRLSSFLKGAMEVIPISYKNERYMRVHYDLTGTSPRTTVDAFLTSQEPSAWEAMPNAID